MRKIMYAFVVLSLLFCGEKSVAQSDGTEQQKKEIQWVNPGIKETAGLSHHIFSSHALGLDVGYSIWLPAGYDTEAEVRYPVLYFLHGMGGNESADASAFSGIVSKAIQDKLLPPVICVFPNGGVSFYRGEVEDMIIDELIPLVDRDYRTIADGRSRALCGFSMGGFGSVYFSVKYPEMFCAAGSMGGGLWRADDSFWQTIEKSIPVWKKKNSGFFFVNGDQDGPEAFKHFAAMLAKNGIEHEVVILPDTKHDLGKYYNESSSRMLQFIGTHLQAQP